MKKVKEIVDPKLKTEKHPVKKAVYKILWLLCTARNAVVVIVCACIASILVDLRGFKPGGRDFFTLTGRVSEGIPLPQVPNFTINHFDDHTNHTITRSTSEIFSDIGEGFIVVALIGLLESIAIAKAFARRNEYQIDPNQELIAIGLANTFSCFFHSYPVTGSFSRTAINSQSGVRTPVGSIWTGAIVLLALGVLTPYFYYIPQASLAAVIICAVIMMFDYEILIKLFKVKKLDLVPLLLTFFVSIFGNIEFGIMAGVGFSIVILIFPMARPGLTIRHEKCVDQSNMAPDDTISVHREAVVIEPNQGLKFPGIEYIKDKVMKHGVYEDPPKAIVLNAQHFSGTDYSTVQGLTQICEYFVKHDLNFVLASPNAEVRTILDNAEIKGLKIAATEEEALRIAFDSGSEMSSTSLEEGKINEAYIQSSADLTEVKTDADMV